MSEPEKEKVTPPPTNPETEPGKPGVSADGTVIPVEQMVDDRTHGANREALDRFRAGAQDSATLLAMLGGAASMRPAHRPDVMTRGDILPHELPRLENLLTKLKELTSQRVRFSALAYSLFCLLVALIETGEVYTERCRETTLAAYGFDQATIDTFDTALGIVWSMAHKSPYTIVPGMTEAVRQLITELGLDEEDML